MSETVDAAWGALQDDVRSGRGTTEGRCVEQHRPRIEAAIRGDERDAWQAYTGQNEGAESDAPNGGTLTQCPLEGVHEHAFRGPHTFHEWYPAQHEPWRRAESDERVAALREAAQIVVKAWPNIHHSEINALGTALSAAPENAK